MDLIEWLLLAQLVGEAEDACVDAGDVFAQRVARWEIPASATWNPPAAFWTPPPPPVLQLATIAHEAWTAIHEHFGVKLVDRPLVRDEVVRTFDPDEFPFRLFPRKK